MSSTPTGELGLIGVDAPVRFGKYTLLTRLATGGMGEVYVAQMGGTAGFEKQVVIKRILPQLARDQHFVRMFLDEARITAQLNHPNICQVFDLGEIDGEYYIAMEYLEGLPLSRLIQKHAAGGIELRVAMGILVQACEGLAYAHDFRDPARRIEGVVHRDVSPQNLFVTAPGLVKVLDFGVAKLYREGSQTVTVSTKGKHLYMAPEQVNGDSVDQRSDTFALATVMFEALTGQSVFGRATQFLTLQAIVNGDRPRIRALRPDVPAAVEAVFERALSLKPDDRFPTARAMGEAFTFAISSLGGPASNIELAQFVQREHVDELSSERARIQRASARILPSLQERPTDVMPVVDEDVERLDHELDSVDDHESSYDEPTVEAPSALRPSNRAIEFVRVNTQDEVRDYFELEPQPWRRYLRWALVASITVGAALWFGRGYLQRAPAAEDWLATDSDLLPSATTGTTAGEAAETGRRGADRTAPDERPGAGQEARPGDGQPGGTGERVQAPGAAVTPPEEAGGAVDPDQPDDAEDKDRQRRPRVREPERREPERREPERREEDGYFTIDARPYAEVYIDGKKLGLTPLVKIPLAPGRHKVRAVAVESGEVQAFRIQVTPRKTLTRQVTFPGDD